MKSYKYKVKNSNITASAEVPDSLTMVVVTENEYNTIDTITVALYGSIIDSFNFLWPKNIQVNGINYVAVSLQRTVFNSVGTAMYRKV